MIPFEHPTEGGGDMARKAKRNGSETKAALYIRVSTVHQVESGCSLAAQAERLTAYAKSAGLEIVAVFREEGISGGIPISQRPEGQELVSMIEAGEVGHVIALKLDRLFRSNIDALRTVEEWDRLGISLHLTDMGGCAMSTGSAVGKMMLAMMSAYAQFEKDLIGERTAAALLHKKENNQVYSPVPYGRSRDGDALLENEDELGVIEKMRTWQDEGLSLRGIAARLNEQGVPTKQGRTWHASTVRGILGAA